MSSSEQSSNEKAQLVKNYTLDILDVKKNTKKKEMDLVFHCLIQTLNIQIR